MPAVASAITVVAADKTAFPGATVAVTPQVRLRQSSRYCMYFKTLETATGPLMCVCNRPKFGDVCHCLVCDAGLHRECVDVRVGGDYERESCFLAGGRC